MGNIGQEEDLILKKKRSREDNFICRGIYLIVITTLLTVTILGIINYLGI